MKMPKLEDILTTVPVVYDDHYEGIAGLKMFPQLFCFEQVKALKNVREKLTTSKIKKKRKSRDESKRYLKNA